MVTLDCSNSSKFLYGIVTEAGRVERKAVPNHLNFVINLAKNLIKLLFKVSIIFEFYIYIQSYSKDLSRF